MHTKPLNIGRLEMINMDHICKITIGDVSGEGHDRSQVYYLRCNKPNTSVRDAWFLAKERQRLCAGCGGNPLATALLDGGTPHVGAELEGADRDLAQSLIDRYLKQNAGACT